MTSKKRNLLISTVLITIGIFNMIILPAVDQYVLTVEALDECARQTYKDFGKELKNLDHDVKAMQNDKATLNSPHSGDYLNGYVRAMFSLTEFKLSQIESSYSSLDFIFFFNDLTKRLDALTSDHKISKAENRFLMDLSQFTKEVITLHNSHSEGLKPQNYNDSFIKKLSDSHQTTQMYHGFINDTDRLLNSERYAYLKNFEGDYTEFNYALAEKICREAYTKLIGDKPLTYNNMKEIYKRDLLFQTMPLEQDLLSPEAFNKTGHDYVVQFHKDHPGILISIDSYDDSGEALSPSALDEKAGELAKKINVNAKRLEPNLDDPYVPQDKNTFKYTFLVNPKGQTDEERNMNIKLLKSGEVLSIWLPVLPY